jgi:hypothetical protein
MPGGYRVSFRGRHYARLDGSAIIDGSQDILDIDKFWSDELMNVNQDRLFGCSFAGVEKFGLFGNHAYSVLRTKEAKGNDGWSFVTHGALQSGPALGQTARRNGTPIRLTSSLSSGTALGTTGNLSWNVSGLRTLN